MDTIKEQKKKLRKTVKEKIAALTPEYCESADIQICGKVLALEAYQNADVVFCYVGTKNEINTTPILKDVLNRGKQLGVPKCISRGVMEVYEIDSLEQLVPGFYGIMEPAADCRKISPEEIDFVCVPCLTCSKDGTRLGYGGGYYDRFLSKISCNKVVLCRSSLMEEGIPVDEYDVRIDVVVTDD